MILLHTTAVPDILFMTKGLKKFWKLDNYVWTTTQRIQS